MGDAALFYFPFLRHFPPRSCSHGRVHAGRWLSLPRFYFHFPAFSRLAHVHPTAFTPVALSALSLSLPFQISRAFYLSGVGSAVSFQAPVVRIIYAPCSSHGDAHRFSAFSRAFVSFPGRPMVFTLRALVDFGNSHPGPFHIRSNSLGAV